MVQQAYLSGFERKEFAPMGVKLAPLTLGHVSVLAITENGLIDNGGKGATVESVASFLYICSFPRWEQALEEIRNDNAAQAMFDWAEKYPKAEAYTDAAEVLKEYIEYYCACPQNKFPTSEVRNPWWWSYAEFLQSELGKSEKEAWGTIVADAFSYFACWAVRKGSKDILAEHERAVIDQIRSGKTIKQLFEEGKL
jgi:hypothetical protein